MPKESESLNHKENSNSKMIAIPPTPQVEEVLISDEEQPESDESQPYEARLNEKLRDLGLYEDGMTIQQKEELLAVVVASWQTAEEEKTRRQFYQDYVNASEAFCNDQIEFSFKESPECSNHASLYNSSSHYFDIPLPPGSPSDSYSKDTGTKSLTPNGDLSQSQAFTSDIASDSSLDNCDDTNCTASSSELFVTSDGKSQVRRGKGKRGRATKQSAGAPNVSGTQSTTNIKRVRERQFIDILPRSESLEQSFSSWKPCSSPKDIPLSCPKKPWLTELEEPCDYIEEDLSSKMVDLMKDLDFARLTNYQRHPPDRTLSKPYHLTRRGNFSKRNNRPDKTDFMVGVSSAKTTVLESKEPVSRTYRYVPVNRTRPNSSNNNNFEAQTTRSGLKYGLYTNPNAVVVDSKETEQLMSLDEGDDSKWPTSLEERESPTHHLYSEVEVILDENLPKFNDLRPGLYGEGFSFTAEVSEQVNSVHKFEGVCEAKNHSVGESTETINHNANSSFVDNDSSDGSSVIDVETVVDDEIEEFVLKRKMLQEYQCTEKEPNASQSKRLKKTSL